MAARTSWARSPGASTPGSSLRWPSPSRLEGLPVLPRATLRPMEGSEGTFSRDEAARRADVEPQFLDELIQLGIINTDDAEISRGNVRRIGLVKSLQGAGIPMDRLAEAMHSGAVSLDFVETSAYQHFSALGGETFAEASARTEIPLPLLSVLREAIGRAQPEPNDRLRDDEQLVLPFIATQLKNGFRPKAIERLLRAQGDSLR